MEYTRLLRRGMTGEDVRHVKDRLVELGYLGASTHNRFGSDTHAAVMRYQADHTLEIDGVVGPLTWASLFGKICGDSSNDIGCISEDSGEAGFYGDIPANIGEAAGKVITVDLAGISGLRLGLVLEALKYAFDPQTTSDYPHSLYIRGGNLYNTDLAPNVITLARIASGASRQPQYYDGGRREMMEEAVRHNPAITGADCSGGIVGLLRHAGAVAAGFDANANTLAKKHAHIVTRATLTPGDWLHKNGHIGLYAGGGYGVEWMGGAYGCQLTKVDDRRGYSFVSGKSARMGAWTGFMRPTYY